MIERARVEDKAKRVEERAWGEPYHAQALSALGAGRAREVRGIGEPIDILY